MLVAFLSLNLMPDDNIQVLLNNIAVIYHYQGTKASEKKEFEIAKDMFDKAGDYWKNAIRLAPNNYIEAQNWLNITGKLTDNLS